jgi:hypothetical protein
VERPVWLIERERVALFLSGAGHLGYRWGPAGDAIRFDREADADAGRRALARVTGDPDLRDAKVTEHIFVGDPPAP